MLADYQRLMKPSEGQEAGPGREQKAIQPGMTGRAEPEAVSAYRHANARLGEDLISRIHAQVPAFFEELVIDVLLAIGYGARRRDLAQRLGRTGDGGVDGLISQDELGLDLIYIQAKRLRPGTVVPVSEVRDFAGSLDAHRANKGVFVTTSHFSTPAIEFCSQVSRRVVLIDGARLAELMIRHNIGVTVIETYQIKRVDTDYFSAAATRIREMISASSQPRK